MGDAKHRVGIVMLLYNRADVAVPCLRSLARARGETPFELFLLDNGSRAEESERVREEFERLVGEGLLQGEFLRSDLNHGFPKGNNIGLRRFLERDDLSHLCLLNSDVVVPDHWLDHLLERDADAVGPVTNACGNEQTVPVPRLFEPGEEVLEATNRWSAERRALFAGRSEETSFLGFFCFVARIELFYRVGFLDERFGRGAYEDDDYCLRVLAEGFRMAVARDVFVYHWGTASFGQVPQRTLSRLLRRNRKKLVDKVGAPWQDRSLLPLRGALNDLVALAAVVGEDAERMAERHAEQSVDYARSLVERERRAGAQGRLVRFLGRVRARLLGRWRRSRAARVLDFLRDLSTRRPVLVLGRWFPTEGDLGDGYFQRVLRIDGLLADHCRVYLRSEGSTRRGRILPGLSRAGRRTYELRVELRNPLHLALAFAVALACRRVYVHSVLRFHNPFFSLVYRLASLRVLDLHGAVPEEFETEGELAHARTFGERERFAVERAHVLVVVSEAMGEHIRAKYGASARRAIVCVPMLPGGGRWAAETARADRRGAVYAGGLHPWQQLDKMLAYAHQHARELPFTFLVTDPERVRALWNARYGASEAPAILRVPASEVAGWYERHAFGLVFRQPVTLNAVACPTKLVEYLQSGLVPIVDSPAIGDFPRLGYRYARLDEPLPSAEEARAMAEQNRLVLRRLHCRYQLGAEELRGRLRGRG